MLNVSGAHSEQKSEFAYIDFRKTSSMEIVSDVTGVKMKSVYRLEICFS